MAEYISLIANQMLQRDIEPPSDGFVVDDKLHRFPKNGKHKENSWYALHYFDLDNGERVITGRFGDWKLNVDEKVELELPELTAEDKARFKAEMRNLAKKAEQEKKNKSAEAAVRAAGIWNKLPVEGHSQYLQAKKVAAFGVRFSRGSIVVPLVNIKNELVGLQFIKPDGSKMFLTGTAKKGAFHFIGVFDSSKPLLLAEGYATAASLHMATGLSVLVCFDAGNLEPVARVWQGRVPVLDIVICGDNDVNNPRNPGLTKAKAAARAVGGRYIVPPAKMEVDHA